MVGELKPSLIFMLSLMITSCWTMPVNTEGSGQLSEREIRQELLDDGWFIAGPDYAYKLTRTQISWGIGRRECKNMGGDLAVFGVRDNTLRWKIGQSLYKGPVWIGLWVGLNDRKVDSEWRWTDGSLAIENEILWSPQEPNGDSRENCGEMWGEDRRFTINDAQCRFRRYALCERKIVW
ncbi:CD209 antigen-like protein B [Clavelina lepadiformis]|uniref:C-type lectin domain-containing protein n=1 Tax=Clavelina lepadiformis TaxID=159417 RepID=A0ABP0H3I5_CLALP